MSEFVSILEKLRPTMGPKSRNPKTKIQKTIRNHIVDKVGNIF